ncbi:MAG TPA: methyltransferase domain-containing protein [Acidimicrobiales bacterium]|nr:methyltransferase domain-containing protein [Acidimicrobiales bacterium]
MPERPPGALTKWFPPGAAGPSELDRALMGGGRLHDVVCPVCGQRTMIERFTENIRESGYCTACGAWTRIRQLAAVLIPAARTITGTSVRSVVEMVPLPDLRIYNTEAHGSLHDALAAAPEYVCSEFFGPELRSGDRHQSGVIHQDLQELSFPDESFDVVISTDVLEHVPDPYRAHREILRVLRPGGHHVFTVPYVDGAALDQVRARLGPGSSIEHMLEPVYHDDPVRPGEGALVFTIFGLEMIPNLARIGFETTVYRLYDPARGLVGPGGLVFDAVKA